MKVILVNGSPHKHGCTYTALNEIAQSLEKQNVESELFWLGNKPLGGCIDCGVCFKTGRCFMDDEVNAFLDMSKTADGFIFGSPVHYAALSGTMTSFMDRVFYGGKEDLRGKPAAGIVSCRRGGSTAAFDQVNKYFTISNMPIVASQYWNMVHGTSPDEVRQDLEGLQIMRTLGSNMAWLLQCIQAGKEAGIELPEKEAPARTNFIR